MSSYSIIWHVGCAYLTRSRRHRHPIDCREAIEIKLLFKFRRIIYMYSPSVGPRLHDTFIFTDFSFDLCLRFWLLSFVEKPKVLFPADKLLSLCSKGARILLLRARSAVVIVLFFFTLLEMQIKVQGRRFFYNLAPGLGPNRFKICWKETHVLFATSLLNNNKIQVEISKQRYSRVLYAIKLFLCYLKPFVFIYLSAWPVKARTSVDALK